jgi:NAD(P)-dependent dehydrogenase (short-subunit alcohol dehydrogenase family)
MSADQSTRRVAVITGASSGIGEATARALHADGQRVALLARRGDRIHALADELGNGAVAIRMAVAVEEHGREILEVYLQAMRGGDWRAAEALMSRIYGKPTENVVTHTPASPEKALIASMTLEEKLELLHKLQAGDPVELTVVEPAPPTA